MIDRSADRALYRQLVDLMLERIRTGELAPGAVVPTADALARTYGVGVDTARESLAMLRADGWVSSPGRGSTGWVRERKPQVVALKRGSSLAFRHPTAAEASELDGLHFTAVVVEVTYGLNQPEIYDALVTEFTSS